MLFAWRQAGKSRTPAIGRAWAWSGTPSVVVLYYGPLKVEAGMACQGGAEAGQSYQGGAEAAEAFQGGAEAGQAHYGDD